MYHIETETRKQLRDGMIRVERSVKIAASQRDVFEHVANCDNVLDFMHNVRQFKPRGPRDYGVGARFHWETVVRGFRVGWEIEVTEFEPYRWMAAKGLSFPHSNSSWRFLPAQGGTVASFAIDCELPRTLIAFPLARRLAEREIATNVERSLVNLRASFEGSRSPAPARLRVASSRIF